MPTADSRNELPRRCWIGFTGGKQLLLHPSDVVYHAEHPYAYFDTSGCLSGLDLS